MKKLLPILLICFSAVSMHAARFSDLRRSFVQVPDSVRCAVYWYWINGNISEEGVVKDLEAMKRVGITRAFIGNISTDNFPKGAVPFMSDKWWEITHTAMKKAGELGIEIGMFNCPGWSQSGGPWVKEEESMRFVEFEDNPDLARIPQDQLISVIAYRQAAAAEHSVTISPGDDDTAFIRPGRPFTARSLTLTISSPGAFSVDLSADGVLVRTLEADRSNPAANVGFKPLAPLTYSLPALTADVYGFRFKFPEDFDGEVVLTLSDRPVVEDYAGKSLAKMFQSPLPMWDFYMWDTPCENSTSVLPPSGVLELTSLVRDGRLEWKAPSDGWTVCAAYMKTTGSSNAPAPEGGEGLEIDKMSSRHIRTHFDAYLGEIVRRIPPEDRTSWKVVVEDSYETGGTNWTDDMRDVFQTTYGYDPVPFLPVLRGVVVGSADQSDRFLWDLRRLVADRVAYDYVAGMRDAAHENGMQTWLECYGHWGFPSEFLMYGGQSDQIAGEYWSEGDLGDIENRAASSCGHIYGKNRIWAESCTAGAPQFWRHPRMMKKRVDHFFCEGINATLLHLFIQQPDDRQPGYDAWFGNEFNRNNCWFDCMDDFTAYLRRCNHMLQQGRYVADVAYYIGEDAPKMTGVRSPEIPAGYDFDYVNAEILKTASRVEDGCLVLDSGMRYRVLVLPPQKTMRPEVLECICRMVDEGLVVLGPAPEKSPSMEKYGEADEMVREMASALWGGKCGEGRVYPEGTSLETVFTDLGIAPDFSAEAGVEFIHRSLGSEGDIYFVSNQEDRSREVELGFRVAEGLEPEVWNPVNGTFSSAVWSRRGGKTYVRLGMDRLESAFVVFSPAHQPPGPVRTGELAVTGKWKVAFSPSCGNEGFVRTFDTLADWAASDDYDVKYYSGKAVYANSFKLSKAESNSGKVLLDLGEAAVMAKVRVNGVDCGGVWTWPYVVDISSCVRSGRNRLEVTVYNNWWNRLSGDLRLPEADRKTWTNINPVSSDGGLQPSGLLGPVRIETYQ